QLSDVRNAREEREAFVRRAFVEWFEARLERDPSEPDHADTAHGPSCRLHDLALCELACLASLEDDREPTALDEQRALPFLCDDSRPNAHPSTARHPLRIGDQRSDGCGLRYRGSCIFDHFDR